VGNEELLNLPNRKYRIRIRVGMLDENEKDEIGLYWKADSFHESV